MAFPTTGILDDFNRTENPLSQGGIWTLGGSGGGAADDNFRANGTQCIVATTNGWAMMYRGDTSYTDTEAYYTIVTKPAQDNGIQVIARYNSTTKEFYFVEVITLSGTDSISLYYSDVDGVSHQIGSTVSQEITNGDSIGIECIGTTITAYYKSGAGAWTATAATGTDANLASGYIGLGMWWADATAVADNFGGGTVTSATATSAHQFIMVS